MCVVIDQLEHTKSCGILIMINKGKFTHTYISYYTFLLFFLPSSPVNFLEIQRKFPWYCPQEDLAALCVAFPT